MNSNAVGCTPVPPGREPNRGGTPGGLLNGFDVVACPRRRAVSLKVDRNLARRSDPTSQTKLRLEGFWSTET